MPDSVISGGVGLFLIGLGGVLIYWHCCVWQEHRADPALDDRERRHFRTQFRRRLQTSGLLIVLGIMIPVGDIFIPWQLFPRMFSLYWIVVLLLAFWVIALAAFDWLATRMHSRLTSAALASVLRKQRELEDEIERLRNRQPTNGRDLRNDRAGETP